MNDRELWVFVRCLYSGVIFGLMFDGFKIIRESFFMKSRFTGWCDGLFWTVFTAFFIKWIFKINDGSIRWFVFAGTALGAGIYFLMFSSAFVKIGLFLTKAVKKTVCFVLKAVMFPLKIFVKITGKAIIVAIAPVKKAGKKINNLKHIFNRKIHIKKICAKKI